MKKTSITKKDFILVNRKKKQRIKVKTHSTSLSKALDFSTYDVLGFEEEVRKWKIVV